MELGNRQEEREARAWQLITTKAVGNSGKIWALEYLSSEQLWPLFPKSWLLNKERTSLHGINLTPPDAPGVEEREFAPLIGRCPLSTYLTGVEIPEAELRNAVLICADLRGADLRGAELSDAVLRDADLQEADLGPVKLGREKVPDADIPCAHLNGARLYRATLRNADFGSADLPGATLRYADLTDAEFNGADLRGANLEGADFKGTQLLGADLYNANLEGARNLTCAQLSRGTRWDQAFRDESLACGRTTPGPIMQPVPGKENAKRNVLRDKCK